MRCTARLLGCKSEDQQLKCWWPNAGHFNEYPVEAQHLMHTSTVNLDFGWFICGVAHICLQVRSGLGQSVPAAAVSSSAGCWQ